MVAQSPVDIIATQILLDAKSALASLKNFNSGVENASVQLANLKELVKAVAAQMNNDFTAAAKAVSKVTSQLGISPALVQKIGKDFQMIEKFSQSSLQGVSNKSLEAKTRIEMLSGAIAAMAVKSKTSVDSVVQSLRTLNASTGTKFGKLGFSDVDISNAGKAAQQTATSLKQVGTAGVKAGEDVQSVFKKVFSTVNALRIALGALVSMALFQVIQSISNAFNELTGNIRESELALYNLINAERILSEEGIIISPKDLQDIIDGIKELVPILSTIQSEELVSRIATNVAPSLKLGRAEIDKMAKSVALLYVQNKALGYTFDEVEKGIADAFLTGKVSQGINKLGVKITEQIVMEKAIEMGLIRDAEAYSKLTGEMLAQVRAMAMLEVMYDGAIKNQEQMGRYMESTDAAIESTKNAWSDFLTQFGTLISPLIGFFNRFFTMVIKGWQYLLRDLRPIIGGIIGLFVGLGAVVEKLMSGKTFSGDSLRKVFSDAVANFKKSFNVLGFAEDTPTNFTGAPQVSDEQQAENEKKAKEHGDKLAEIMRDNADKLADIERHYQEKIEDINRDYGEKLDDIARNTAQKREDAARDYSQKIEDINRDAAEKVAEAQIDYRKKEIDREAEFQRKLRELRQKFLFDLEDALRERDARQVLRLIRQYQMDKKSLEDKRRLDANESKKDLAQKLAEIERERLLKLEAAKREYAEKLEEIAIGERRALADARIWLSRQLAEARLWHSRQLIEQREYLKRKLEDLRRAYEQELKMAQDYGSKINKVLSDSGVVAGSGVGNNTKIYNPTGVTAGSGVGMAEGGTIIARKPTVAIFGERGAEAATFKPIGRSGTDVNKVFGDIGGMGGSGGFINIAMSLSPDLEARVVETSLENVAVHLERMVRTG